MRRIPIVALAFLFLPSLPLLAQQSAPAPIVRQKPAKASATKPAATPKPAVKPDPLVPLTDRERALQLLDRFTFGPRPGDVDAVLALGADKWFEQQLNPDAIKDPALDRRLADFPTLAMSPEQALTVFPDRGAIQQIADGKKPMPADPLLAAMYEVQIAKLRKEQANRKPDASGNLPEPSDAEKAAERQGGQFAAGRIAGELLALPRNQRMAALIRCRSKTASPSPATPAAIREISSWRTSPPASARSFSAWPPASARNTRLARSSPRPRWSAPSSASVSCRR